MYICIYAYYFNKLLLIGETFILAKYAITQASRFPP